MNIQANIPMNDILKKQYDYWLIVWITKNDEEIHSPTNFQKGIHPKDYCDEIMKSDFKTGKGEVLKDLYKSYKLYPLKLCEYSHE